MSKPLSDDELREIRERVALLKPGTWTVGKLNNEIYPHLSVWIVEDDGYDIMEDPPWERVRFIAHARTDIPRLLDEIARLRARYDTEVRDNCETDTEIRNLARPVLGDAAVDGDSEHRPGVVDVVRAVIGKMRSATVHADDDEPVKHGVVYQNDFQRIQILNTGVGRIGAYLTRFRRMNHDVDNCQEMFLCDVETMGQLRDLLRLLGIPLEETKAT